MLFPVRAVSVPHLIGFMALLAVASLSHAADAPVTADLTPLTGEKSPLKAGDVVSFFGDSVTWQGGYVDQLQKALDEKRADLKVKFNKRGLNGGKSGDLVKGAENLYGTSQKPFTDVLAADKPAVAAIFIGINDVWHNPGTSPGDYEANLRTMVKAARDAKVAVVLATPTVIGEKTGGANPLDKKLDQYSEIVRKVAADVKAPVADLRAAFTDHLKSHNPGNTDKGLLTYDGVHMNETGNALIATTMSRAVAEALKNR